MGATISTHLFSATIVIFLPFSFTNAMQGQNSLSNVPNALLPFIFQFLDWNDFYSAIELYEITEEAQKIYFPKYLKRQFGNHWEEYYYDSEKGDHILPPAVKQMEIITFQAEEIARFILFQNNMLEAIYHPTLTINQQDVHPRELSRCFKNITRLMPYSIANHILQLKTIAADHICNLDYQGDISNKNLDLNIFIFHFDRSWLSISPSFAAYEISMGKSKYQYVFLWHKFEDEEHVELFLCRLVKSNGQLSELDELDADAVYALFDQICSESNIDPQIQIEKYTGGTSFE